MFAFANQLTTFSSLDQYKFDLQTLLDEGAITTHDSVVFKATLTDPDGDDVKLQVELKEFNQSFDGQDLLESDLIISGSAASITRYGLVNGKYHWRARAVDENGAVSDWREFGEDGNVDFEIKIMPLYTQLESEYPSIVDTRRWSARNYANATPEKPYPSCGWLIEDCGCAITSATMIARYYDITEAQGADVNPETINEWLRDNNGYQNGDVNWVSMARFTDWRMKYEKTDQNTNNLALLDGKLNNHQPVIAKANSGRGGIDRQHFFVIDEKLSSTYSVKDPSWYNTKTLNEGISDNSQHIRNYENGFDGLRIYKEGDGIAQSAITIALGSPAELLITDLQGRRLGKDENNIEYSEIPEAWYFEDGFDNPFGETSFSQERNKLIQILEPINGQYNIQAIGTGEGSYTLDMLAYDNEGDSQDIIQKGDIQAGAIQEYELNYSQESADDIQLKRIIEIDIKPGSDPNSINCQNEKGIITVAVLATDLFDASTVNTDTIRFGPNKAQEIHSDKNDKARQHLEDIDNDGDLDLILHFKFEDTGIECGDTEAMIVGQTQEGFDVMGTDTIRIIENENRGKPTFIGRLLSLLVGINDILSSLTN